MQNTGVLSKAPHPYLAADRFLKFVKIFKYEIIKILIFLFIFFASLLFVNSQSKIYYDNSKSNLYYLKNQIFNIY